MQNLTGAIARGREMAWIAAKMIVLGAAVSGLLWHPVVGAAGSGQDEKTMLLQPLPYPINARARSADSSGLHSWLSELEAAEYQTANDLQFQTEAPVSQLGQLSTAFRSLLTRRPDSDRAAELGDAELRDGRATLRQVKQADLADVLSSDQSLLRAVADYQDAITAKLDWLVNQLDTEKSGLHLYLASRNDAQAAVSQTRIDSFIEQLARVTKVAKSFLESFSFFCYLQEKLSAASFSGPSAYPQGLDKTSAELAAVVGLLPWSVYFQTDAEPAQGSGAVGVDREIEQMLTSGVLARLVEDFGQVFGFGDWLGPGIGAIAADIDLLAASNAISVIVNRGLKLARKSGLDKKNVKDLYWYWKQLKRFHLSVFLERSVPELNESILLSLQPDSLHAMGSGPDSDGRVALVKAQAKGRFHLNVAWQRVVPGFNRWTYGLIYPSTDLEGLQEVLNRSSIQAVPRRQEAKPTGFSMGLGQACPPFRLLGLLGSDLLKTEDETVEGPRLTLLVAEVFLAWLLQRPLGSAHLDAVLIRQVVWGAFQRYLARSSDYANLADLYAKTQDTSFHNPSIKAVLREVYEEVKALHSE